MKEKTVAFYGPLALSLVLDFSVILYLSRKVDEIDINANDPSKRQTNPDLLNRGELLKSGTRNVEPSLGKDKHI